MTAALDAVNKVKTTLKTLKTVGYILSCQWLVGRHSMNASFGAEQNQNEPKTKG